MTELPGSTPDDPQPARRPTADDYGASSGQSPAPVSTPASGSSGPAEAARHRAHGEHARPWYRRPFIWSIVIVALLIVAVGVPFAYAQIKNANAPAPFATLTAAADAGRSPSPSTQAGAGTHGATPSGAAAALDGTWQVAAGSQAGYRVNEVLNGQPTVVVGRTDQVTGKLSISNGALTSVQVTVQLADVTTDSGARDGQFRGPIMQTEQYPTATFVSDAVVPLDAAGGQTSVPGMLTIKDRGVEASAQVTYSGSADGAKIEGAIPVTFSSWGIEAPNLGFVKVEPSGTVEFSLTVSRTSGVS